MAANLQGFNIGTDAAVTVTDNFGDAFPIDQLGLMMDFESDYDDAEIKVVPITGGGVPIFQTVWAGGHGRIGFTRRNGNLELMTLQLVAAYHNIGLIPIFTLLTTVLNRDGSVDERLYTGVQFNRPRFGNYRALKEVDQGLQFSYGLCQPVGGATPFLTGLALAA